MIQETIDVIFFFNGQDCHSCKYKYLIGFLPTKIVDNISAPSMGLNEADTDVKVKIEGAS